MSLLAADLGGTKLAVAAFSNAGKLLSREIFPLAGRSGAAAGALISSGIDVFIRRQQDLGDPVEAVGIAVPGISRQKTGTVWAPNIPGWEDYPLLHEVREVANGIPVAIDSDRACYILGEHWQGNARGCRDAIFLAVGTGIGAGILVHGQVLRGAHDIAGAIGWLALDRPFQSRYVSCGCFEYHASGAGLAKVAREFLEADASYTGLLHDKAPADLNAGDVFAAFDRGDALAADVIRQGIAFWGMAVANLVSLFNPEKIILGGGVFGPALRLLPEIRQEAARWAQPISMTQVSLEGPGLGNDSGLFGAGYLALGMVK